MPFTTCKTFKRKITWQAILEQFVSRFLVQHAGLPEPGSQLVSSAFDAAFFYFGFQIHGASLVSAEDVATC